MTTNLLRAGALSCALLASTALTAPALAQTAQQFRQPDANGVDVTHGDYLMNFVEGSIGSGDSEPVAAAHATTGGSAPAAPPITMFCAVQRFSHIV